MPSSWILLAVAVFAVDCGGGQDGGRTCVITPPAPPDWRLVPDGTHLRDGLGRLVFLRGVDGGGRSKFAPYVPFDYSDYASALGTYMDRAASWGIDCMRVPFTWAAVEPTQGNFDQGWLSLYDQLLDAAWARGIWTVIDFHQDVYAEVFCGDGFPAWTLTNPPAHQCPDSGWGQEYVFDPAVMGAFDAFWPSGSQVMTEYQAAWDFMVARYKDKPGVLGFEPINEPGWGSQPEPTFTATTLTSFYSVMVPRMRAEAPMSLVFVDATGLDGGLLTTSLQKPMGDGIVFAPHFYPLGNQPDGVAGNMQNWLSMSASWNVPLWLGEMGEGVNSANINDYMAAHWAAFDGNGAVGGAWWEYSTSQQLWNNEMNSIVAPDGTERPVVTAIIRPFARAVAGDSIQQAWDGTSTTYTLSFTPTSGITDVSLPKRAWSSGYQVALTGACYDDTSEPGQMLLQPDPGAAEVSLTITSK